MNPLHSSLAPLHGMARAACDALVHELVAAGIEVLRVDEVQPGVVCRYCHRPMPDHGYWITHAQGFRESVRASSIAWLPPSTLP